MILVEKPAPSEWFACYDNPKQLQKLNLALRCYLCTMRWYRPEKKETQNAIHFSHIVSFSEFQLKHCVFAQINVSM